MLVNNYKCKYKFRTDQRRTKRRTFCCSITWVQKVKAPDFSSVFLFVVLLIFSWDLKKPASYLNFSGDLSTQTLSKILEDAHLNV